MRRICVIAVWYEKEGWMKIKGNMIQDFLLMFPHQIPRFRFLHFFFNSWTLCCLPALPSPLHQFPSCSSRGSKVKVKLNKPVWSNIEIFCSMQWRKQYHRLQRLLYDVVINLFISSKKLKVVAQGTETYGTFYSGDSYICLSVSCDHTLMKYLMTQ